MATTFLARLGRLLSERGHQVSRVNFNGGDRLFWPLPGAVDFKAPAEQWPGFLDTLLSRRKITDIVLFGDCRPLHRTAVAVAAEHGIRVHVFEEGYLRPNWVTLEEGGVNGHSALPRDPDWYLRHAESLPPWHPGTPVRGSFFRRSVEDVLYNGAMTLFAWQYPNFRTHRPWHPLVEYASWLKRIARYPWSRDRVKRGMARIAGHAGALYLFPLQLDSDSQIRQHYQPGRMTPAVEEVIRSFAHGAPPDAILAIKQHPLDNAMINWRLAVERLAAAHGVSDRVIYLEGGRLEELFRDCRGVITINSTTGFLALSFNLPVIALGSALYDVPTLTFQGKLDDFWTGSVPPDARTFDAFRRVVAARTQLNGGFFSARGLDMAAAAAAHRLVGDAVPVSVGKPKTTNTAVLAPGMRAQLPIA
jgi:capsular polysaccharide export protein